MNIKDISNLRLTNQQITESKFKTAKDIVSWMGAMQAQDFNMVKWAIGVRLPKSTEKSVELAIDNGEIIRTHLLRPTWHLVSCDDIHWMLDLTAPRIKASMKSRDKVLELTPAIYKKSSEVFEKALTGGKHLTREALLTELKKANIATDNNRASHILFGAELDGIICSGKTSSSKHTYALLTEWCPKTKPLDREVALGKLAHRYFTSHSPATLQDFAWWSGLSLTESRQALGIVKSNFVSEIIESQTYWFSQSFSIPETYQSDVHLLPAYDEFLISYTDRSASLPFENNSKAVSMNGIFFPVIIVNGQVAGVWKRTLKKDQVTLETTYFKTPDKSVKKGVEEAFLKYAHFLGKKS